MRVPAKGLMALEGGQATLEQLQAPIMASYARLPPGTSPALLPVGIWALSWWFFSLLCLLVSR